MFDSRPRGPILVLWDATQTLKHAIETGNIRLARSSLKHVDIEAPMDDGDPPLHVAVCRSNDATVALLIEEGGADVNALGVAKWTPLHHAVSISRRSLARLLIEKGADVNAGIEGWSVLHHAVRFCFEDTASVITFLIQNGADVNTKNVHFTPLDIAILYGKDYAVKILIENGADVNLQTRKGFTPLHRAVLYPFSHRHITPLPNSSTITVLSMIDLLLEGKADVNARDNEGKTPLHYAALFKQCQLVKLLLERGADPNATDKKGRTPLHLATQWISSSRCRVDPIINSRTKTLDVMELLMFHGADLGITSKNGKTPLDLLKVTESAKQQLRSLAAAIASGDAKDYREAFGRATGQPRARPCNVRLTP